MVEEKSYWFEVGFFGSGGRIEYSRFELMREGRL